MERLPLMLGAILLLMLTACTSPDKPTPDKPKASPTPEAFQAPDPPRLAPPPSPRELRRKPNIVEILADDMRYDDLRYAPNLRKLVAKRGIFMANTFSNYPLCCPARAAFFSGQYTHNHGVYTVSSPYGYRAYDDRASLATSLSQAGYSTGLVGKYLNNYGVDEALGPKLDWQAERGGSAKPVQSQYYVPAGWDEWRGALQGTYCKPACGGAYHYFKYAWSHNGEPRSSRQGRYSSDVIGAQARNLVKKFSKRRSRTDRPFFLSLNFIAPHTGGAGPAEDPYKALYMQHPCAVPGPAAPPYAYANKLVKAVERGAGLRRNGTAELSTRDKPLAGQSYKRVTKCQAEAIRNSTTMRAAAVYAMDKNIGRIVRDLKRRGEWRRTVFVFWSDNGYFQGEHNRPAGKILPYEPVLRVPLLMTGPGMRAQTHRGIFGGEDRYTPMDVTDLTATLLDLADAAPPLAPDGTTKLGIVKRGDETGKGWAYGVVTEAVATVGWARNSTRDSRFSLTRKGVRDPRNVIGVRTGQYLYVRHANYEWELYDLFTDPNQWFNLAHDKTWLSQHKNVVASLDKAWTRLHNCAGAACRVKLDPLLQLSVRQNATATRAWYDRMAAQYGPRLEKH